MSLWRDEVRAPRTALAIVGLLGLVAMGGLWRVFNSPAYLAWGIPAAVLGAAFALTLGRRSLAAALGALTLLTFLVLPALFVREQTVALFPTPGSYSAVGRLIRAGLSAILVERAPVPIAARFMIVLWLAAVASGFLAAAWVVVGRPLGAIITSVGLIASTGSVGAGPGRDAVGWLAAALLVAFLLADGRARIVAWSRSLKRLPPAWGSGTLAAVCLLALAGPYLLEGRPFVQFKGQAAPRLALIRPLSDIKRQLDVNPPLEVMRVRASQATYWRLTALNNYTGREWELQAKAIPAGDGRVPQPTPAPDGPLIRQQYQITSLLSIWLPAAYSARQLEGAPAFSVDVETTTLLRRDRAARAVSYSVTSQQNSRGVADPGGRPLARRDPAEAQFAAIAAPVVAGANSPMSQALAIQDWFRNTFQYDQQVASAHTRRRLADFIVQRRGYCEQFAATMALMLRGLGTPARVAVGFLPGRVDNGEYVVTTKDAHAWVEAQIPGAGWVTFDPTPGRGTPTTLRRQAEPTPVAPTPIPGAAEQSPSPSPAVNERRTEPGRVPVGPVLAALAVAALAASVPAAKTLRKHRRRSAPPGRAVLGAWAELVDRWADLGYRMRPSETLWDAWSRVFSRGKAPGADAAADVAQGASWALYGPSPASAGDATAVWGRVGPALKGLASTRSRLRRLAAIYDPRTLLSRKRSPGRAFIAK